VNGLAAEMPELVGIAHDIDAGDPALRDLERGRLHAVVLDGDEPRQAVDEAVPYAPRRPSPEKTREPGVKLDDLVKADQGPLGRRPLAAAIGIQDDVAASSERRSFMSPLREAE
jgi:hypothetical protein